MRYTNPKPHIPNPNLAFTFVECLAVIAILVALLASPAVAANYYVSTNGSNYNSGTSLASPFLTIQQAANVAQVGDNVYVRGGTYRETVTVANSGTSSAPITFQPYSGEQVTVTGLDVVNNSWSSYSGSIYSTTVSGGASQLFVGGQMMTEARWPDAGYNNPLHAATSTVGSTVYNPPPTLSTITDPALPAGASLTGAKMSILAGPAYVARSTTIDSQVGTTLSYQWTSGGATWAPVAGNPYYLYSSLAALNSAKEWYCNGSTLYLYAPNGASPSGQSVEVRKRQYGFDIGSQNYVNVDGFKLQAANVNVGGNHNTINNCQILYPAPLADPNGYYNQYGVTLGGQYNTISNLEVAYTWGDGVTLTAPNNTVTNNRIHDVDWSGTDSAGVNATWSGGNCVVSNNTIYNTNAPGIELGEGINVPNMQVLHNDVSRFQFVTQDGGAIYANTNDLAGTVIAYNRVHDQRGGPTFKGGIYLDGNVSGATVHHNLVYNVTRGIYSKGTNGVYNNTIWNCPDAAVAAYFDGSNTTVINNLANNDIQGQQGSNNRYQTADQFTNSAAGDYTLTANSFGSNQGATYKRAVDYGTPIPGITDIDGYAGSEPDAGALERGVTIPDAHNALTAGANWKAWTAGNQAAAPLAAALYVTQSGTRVTTGSLMVGNTTSMSANSRSFLNFDLSGIVCTTIQSAVLRIYENTLPSSAAGSVTLNRVTSAWTNGNVSYNQSVDTVTPITGFYDPSNLDLYTDINITSWVQGWLSNSSTNYGLRLCGSEDVTGTAKYFDGFYGVTAPQLVLTMPEPGDANLDGRVDVSDLAILAANYRKHVTGGWTQADFNNDGVVDVKDLAVLAANYRYGVASDVVPAYDGLDAAAVELLSQAGVATVPEPGALAMVTVVLIGALTYIGRRRR